MKDVVIYDGACGFCQSQVARIRRLAGRDRFELLPRQSPDLLMRFPMLKANEAAEGMRFVSAEGTPAIGADAVYEIYRRIPRFRALAGLYRVPGLKSFFRLAYFIIARNRLRISRLCRNRACELPVRR